MRQALAFIAFTLLAGPGLAQSHSHSPNDASAPYAGLETREIKALSPEQVADLRAGRGMSLALAAELNGYPGPSHALELAEPLRLTPDQRTRTEALFDEMKKRAAQLGDRIVAGEQRLGTLFASGAATAEVVRFATADIASLQGELRALHLNYHLLLKGVLTAQQVARYNVLRGYRSTGPR